MSLPAFTIDEFLERDQYTEEAYFALEGSSRHRWEFLPDGQRDAFGRYLGVIRAMSGGTDEHGAVAASLIAALAVALRGAGRRGCRTLTSDVKVHCGNGRNTYPDLSVVCGPSRYHLGRRDIITNPVLLAEVTSRSTESDDRGGKWQSYQTISGLQYYLIVAQDRVRVELYSRVDSGWRLEVWEDPAALVPLPDLDVSLQVADIYDQVTFADESI